MGTPRQLERPFPLPYEPQILPSQSPTFHYDYDKISVYSSEHVPSHVTFPPQLSNPPRVRTGGADTSSTKQRSGMGMLNSGLSTEDNMSGGAGTMKRTNKTHVPSACVNCKRAHLACDVSRPCKRCVALGKVDTCIDIKHKKRGRPKLKDKKPHPYNTHATADAKTWGQNPQFLPPTTPSPNLHQQSDQIPSSNSHSLISTSQHSSRHHYHHHHHHHHQPHHHQHHNPSLYVTKSPTRSQPQQENAPTITMFLTINNAVCARVSDECLGTLGYYPSELVHKSLFEYVQEREILQKLISKLLEDANQYCHNQTGRRYTFPSDFVTVDDPSFLHANPEDLHHQARGGPRNELSDMLHLKARIGQYDLYNVKMYLGGGLYADLTRRETWNKFYVVALFTRISSNCAQSRMSGNSIVGGFSTQIVSSPTPTIDPSLLTMHNTPGIHNTGSSSLSPGIGSSGLSGSGLLSPDLSPRQIPEIGPPVYNEVGHSTSTLYSHRKPLHPYNSHFSQDHRSISEAFGPIVSRQNPVTSIISRSEPPSGSHPSYPSFEMRPSAFNSIRSPPESTLPMPFYNEMESKPLDSPSYSTRLHDNSSFNNSHRDRDEISSPSSNTSFPTFRNDDDVIIPTLPRTSSTRVSAVEDEPGPTRRMSVNSLLC